MSKELKQVVEVEPKQFNSQLPPDPTRPLCYKVKDYVENPVNLIIPCTDLTISPKETEEVQTEEVQLNYFPDSQTLADKVITILQNIAGHTITITDKSDLS